MTSIKTLRNTNLSVSTTKDLICFSHLRWDFVYQRPQHLMSRFSKIYRVFFVEEPIFDAESSYCRVDKVGESLWRIVPHLQRDLTEAQVLYNQQILLRQLFIDFKIESYYFWYYTPMALSLSNHLSPELIIYDCMDELSNFKFAPPSLKQKEKELFEKADIVFTGGHNLYQAKKSFHHNIYPFPSSIDKEHFLQARNKIVEPLDQASIPYPRFGFYGVIDERMDIDLLNEVSERKPDWQFIIIGPVVKIDPAILPGKNNIHYLGGKTYNELPAYLAGWDVAIIPFLLNDTTKYISPTKTPEYLSAGKPVISTSIKDVVTPYGTNNLVHIADNAEDFITSGEIALKTKNYKRRLKKVDAFLADNSWDNTWGKMLNLINHTIKSKVSKTISSEKDNLRTKDITVKLKQGAYV